MISYLTSADMSIIAFIGVIFAFALTCIAIAKLNKFLPKDLGRQFAVDGKLSAGKPRGAGIIFIFTFVISAVLFSQINAEIAIYLVLIVIEMLTGYFDDAAEKPWGEYLKGALDFCGCNCCGSCVSAFQLKHNHLCHIWRLCKYSTCCVWNTHSHLSLGINQCHKLFRRC